MKQPLLYFVILFTSFSCKNSNKVEDSRQQVLSADSATTTKIIADSESGQYFKIIPENEIKILEQAYIFDATQAYVSKNKSSKEIYSYSPGRKVSVLEYIDGWVGVLDTITFGNKKEYIELFVMQSVVCPTDSLVLKKKDLTSCSFTEDDHVRTGHLPASLAELSFISKHDFNSAYNAKVDFIVYDTLSIRKKDGKLILPCRDRKFVLEDIDSDSDDYQNYTYIGQIEFLDVYVVLGVYYELITYSFYSRKDGEIVASFDNFPVISPNRKYIADIWYNPYDTVSEYSLYIVNGNKVEPAADYSFLRWATYLSPGTNYHSYDEYFFGEDNCIYTRVTDMKLAGYQGKDVENLSQAIKISVNI